eukprot:gb/GEZN01033789.1/.p1 GENE.gb/GEZN01033789.1/~~gb/GEZN01033789.1/.p1  ORF type:complete len:109 (-),score=17.91 gb/GEZN01033789.1/:73-399(-)
MNDFSAAFVTLFEVMVVSNWFVLVNGYGLVTNNLVARAFFLPFYVISVLIILNLTVAFILETFIRELHKKRIALAGPPEDDEYPEEPSSVPISERAQEIIMPSASQVQ